MEKITFLTTTTATITYTKIFLLLIIILGMTGLIILSGTSSAAAQDNTCEIDLQNNAHTCDTVPAISFIHGPAPGTLANEVVMKINLDPNVSGYTKARFDIEYGGTPTNWTVNIGDSHSNNGGSGDGGHQSNDAEMQVMGTTMSVLGNDASRPNVVLLKKPNIVTQGTTLTLEVSDNRLDWDNHNGEAGNVVSEYLYALNGQPDSEGPVNYDIYAGFNRTIQYHPNRCGAGVTKVTITLSHDGEPYFADVTADVGLNSVVGYRISIADVNGDGYPDLLLHTPADEMSGDVLNKQFLYLNVQGDDPNNPYSRKFIDYTEESGIRANRQGTDEGRHSSGAIFADVDNDGDLDMFTTVYVHKNYSLNKGTNELLLNDGYGHFTLAPNSPFHNEPIYNTAAATFLDYNNDGNVDLFIGNYYMNHALTQDQLYQGHGDGSFTNVTGAAGIDSALTCVYAVAAADWNGDGYVDLFAPSYSHTVSGSTPILWKNNSGGTFSQVQESTNYNRYRGYGSGKASFGTMPRDFDNDGDIDLLEILTHGYGDGASGIHSTVITNENGVYSWDFYRVDGRADDDPNASHHGDHYGSWFDIDNDGLTDFVLTECAYSNNRLYLFKQAADNTFHLGTSESGLDSINASNLRVHNATPLDYDLDGDEDLLIGFASEDGVQLWRNDVGTSNNWITISLVGAGIPGHSNKSAIGARVEVTAGGTTYTREVYAGNGHAGPQAPLSLTFGLEQATKVDTIKVRWPNENQTSEELSDVAVNQFVTIYEKIDLRITSGDDWLAMTDPGDGWTDVGFDDSAWINAYAPYPNPSIPQDVMSGTSAEFMWYWDQPDDPDGLSGPGVAYFRYNFFLDLTTHSLPLLAQALVCVDDDFDLYVNGELLLADHDHGLNFRPDGTPLPFSVDFTSLLRHGENVLAIKGIDGWSDIGGRDRLYEWALFDAQITAVSDTVIPEPTTLALLGIGVAGLGFMRRRCKKSSPQ